MADRLPENGIVFVVDDDVSTREALTGLLRSVGHRVTAFPSAQAFLQFLPQTLPACLILDVRLPGLSGLDLQRELELRGLDIPIIFVTAHGDIQMAVRAMKAGAIEFLAKPFREQDVLDAVNNALMMSSSAQRAFLELATLRHRYQTLSEREREVMIRLVGGMRNKQIAADLQVSEVTAKAHRQRILKKMGAASLPALAVMHFRLKSSGKPDGSYALREDQVTFR
jgi:FixJ family two-component response regulator